MKTDISNWNNNTLKIPSKCEIMEVYKQGRYQDQVNGKKSLLSWPYT